MSSHRQNILSGVAGQMFNLPSLYSEYRSNGSPNGYGDRLGKKGGKIGFFPPSLEIDFYILRYMLFF